MVLRGLWRGAFALAIWPVVAMSGSPVTSMILPGQFGTNQSGGAAYTLPIQVPPGTGGVEPKLSVKYDSYAGNGLLGMGWSLSGLSTISRCAQTWAQDGAQGGINYDANDRYCLDGERLIAVSGVYGADGTEYRTEHESYAKIVSYGSAGNGPAWFKMWSKAGQIMEYGNTADSRIEAQGKTTVRAWAINRLSDTKGNYLTVSYTEDSANGSFYPTRIDYTGNATTAVAPNNSVQFTYEPRSDVETVYTGGSMIRQANRLVGIKTLAGTTTASTLTLAYDNGLATKRSRLTKATLCDGAGQCLAPTIFAWQDETATAPGLVTWSTGPAGAGADYPMNSAVPGVAPIYYTFFGDVDGDGKTDVILFNRNANVAAYLPGGTSNASWVLWSQPAWPVAFGQGKLYWEYDQVTIGDVNGDGKTDLIFIDYYNKTTYLLPARQPQPDLLSSVDNGLGGVTSITYKPLTDASVYTKGSGAVYPVVDVQGPMQVVSDVSVTNGLGGQVQQRYTYRDARLDKLSGRGFLGFGAVEKTDLGSGTVSTTWYRQDFPYAYMVDRAQVKVPSGGNAGVLKSVNHSYGCLDPSSGLACTVAPGNRYFSYASQSIDSGWDVSGTALPTITTSTQYDKWGNATQIAVNASDGYGTTTTNSYAAPDLVNWYLGRLLRSTATKTSP